METSTQTVFDEIQTAASDASTSAKRAAEVTRKALSKGIYKTAYVSTYGVVFASVFLIELLPHPGRSVSEELADEPVGLLENKKRGQSLKLTGNNVPGSENRDAEPVPIKRAFTAKKRSLESFS